ncbi:conserved hypothetical protein [Escherichia coli TA206]|uniref:YdcH family protein n=1 Tax=Escherichia coli TaxID=562 RepID=UPI0001E8AA69|nr:DUF465 domain-containing protein [Escherichia coli]EGI25821.1 conserved hypothetical protein [Escherichia coli TA206]
MFPEYRALISALKGKHARFDALFEKHNRLDHEIRRLETEGGGYSQPELVKMKLDKLEIKREIQEILREEAGKRS